MKKAYWSCLFACCGMVILVLDTKTALIGAADGVNLCLGTLIPSLFPFIFLSRLIITGMLGRSFPLFGKLARVLQIPEGCESIFLVGSLAGYPVGAQCISQAVRLRCIAEETGDRMIAFCSNAGPAFIFGIGARLFEEKWMCCALWAVQILSAVMTARMFPKSKTKCANLVPGTSITIAGALKSSIYTMAMICGWVMLFRIILTFCQFWFLWALPEWTQYLFAGFLEVSNGCSSLAQLSDIRIRFVLFSAFISFGGMCVLMQTHSVAEGVQMKNYILGKLLQTIFSFLLATAIVYNSLRMQIIILLALGMLLKNFCERKFYNRVAFCEKEVYNKENTYAR